MSSTTVFCISGGSLPHQQRIMSDFFEEAKKAVVLCGGRNSGKSFCGLMFFAELVARGAESLALMFPTYKLMNKFLHRYFGRNETTANEAIERKLWGRILLPGHWHKQDQWYTTDTGVPIYLFTAEHGRHEDFAAVHADGVWADEPGNMSDAAIGTVVENAMLRERCKLFFSSTPYAGHLRGRFYKYVNDPIATPDDWCVYKVPSVKNTYWWNDAMVARAKATMREHEYQQKVLGEFALPEGLIYRVPSDQRITEAPDDWKPSQWWGGIDWGYANPAAFVLVGRDHTGRDVVMDEWYQSGAHHEEIFQGVQATILRNGIGVNDVGIYADPAQPASIDTMRQMGLRVHEANNKVAQGIARVQHYLSDGLLVHTRCVHLLRECDTYSYREGTDDPEKVDDHACDALRYCCMGMPLDKGVDLLRPVEPDRNEWSQY